MLTPQAWKQDSTLRYISALEGMTAGASKPEWVGSSKLVMGPTPVLEAGWTGSPTWVAILTCCLVFDAGPV